MVSKKFKKVFGIGLGKTGTSSLTEALELLGYDKITHFPINQMDLVMNGYFDAATDTPIAYSFKELAQKFPDAGFILTTRDIDSWLKSIETHMTVGRGKHGARRPEIAKLRTELYGAKKFDKELYRENFKVHILNVMEYFRSNDMMNQLLITSLVDSPGWQPLCDFLQLPVPIQEFPHKNKGLYSEVKK